MEKLADYLMEQELYIIAIIITPTISVLHITVIYILAVSDPTASRLVKSY